MGLISRIFEASQASVQLTNITGEQFFSVAPMLDVYEGCVVQVGVDFPATPTDSAIVSAYARVNGTDWDIVPFTQFTIDNGVDPSRVTLVVKDVFEFRVGIKRDGTTDTIVSADMSSRLWRWSAA